MAAAEKGLALARQDRGLSRVVYLLAQMVNAARSTDFEGWLERNGLGRESAASPLSLIAGFAESMDVYLRAKRKRTDIGEMAQLAATETLGELVSQHTSGLWGDSTQTVQAALTQFSTPAGFGVLAQRFFGRFTERYLGYHLSRELSLHVGISQRFSDPAAHSEFLDKLGAHCREVAQIVEIFAPGWYSKSKFETGLSERSAAGFTDYCLDKLRSEIKRRGGADGR